MSDLNFNKECLRYALVAAAVLCMCAPAVGQETGWFTSEQVKRGGTLYENRCSTCHGAEIAESFEGTDSSAAKIIETIISMGMPQDNPGGLPKQDYTDIVAYIMNLNGLPLGQAVEAGSSMLEEIHLPK